MSIEVDKLSRKFGHQKAVDEISFSMKSGEVVGFLGPNGAGKSTTMKMITGLLLPSSGTATVCGHSVLTEPVQVRKKLGYLPEHNPLYKDMFVREYLEMVADIHKVKHKRTRIGEMIEVTGLTREAHKPINALSKGYRQRVGLAQAMIHDPEVLILDEPTSGLDPNQLHDIRQLIREFGKQKTVLFSTHIMQEVQAICDRVIVINLGKMVADTPISNLDQLMLGQRQLDVRLKGKVSPALIREIPGVKEVIAETNGLFRILYSNTVDIRESIFHLAVKESWVILEMVSSKFSMEDVFHKLTRNH